MAPEQMDNPQQVDHRADIYALGVVFYELLTGELPIGRFAPPSEKAAVDARLDDVVHKTLENEPDRRYQQASEVKIDVDTITKASQSARSTITVKQVLRDWWRDLRTGGEGISQFGFQYLLVGLLKWAAFAFHIFFFYQLVRVIGIDSETKEIGGWMTKSHAGGRPVEFHNAPGPVLAWFVAGLVTYYVYWRIRKTETGSTRRFHYPLRHIVVWVLMIVYGFAMVVDSAESFIPSSLVLVVLFVASAVLQQIWNVILAGKNSSEIRA